MQSKSGGADYASVVMREGNGRRAAKESRGEKWGVAGD